MISVSTKQRGFTIVELLIVIVIIAILAAITIVAFNGVQQRARDAKRKQDVAQIAKLLSIYELDNGPMYLGSNCGSGGNGSGWFNHPYGGGYEAMDQCLVNAGVTNTKLRDTQITCSGLTCRAYMKYSCIQSGRTVTYVYANLETGTHDGTELNGTCSTGIATLYGMNYYVQVSN